MFTKLHLYYLKCDHNMRKIMQVLLKWCFVQGHGDIKVGNWKIFTKTFIGIKDTVSLDLVNFTWLITAQNMKFLIKDFSSKFE